MPAQPFWPLFPHFTPPASAEANTGNSLLDYWRQLAPVYVAALREPDAEGEAPSSVSIEDWPTDISGQQAALTALLTDSKLCAPWREQQRGYARWTKLGTEDGAERDDRLEQAHVTGSRPLAEIPVYEDWIRCSCQQLVCLPESQWQALFDADAHYDPAEVCADTVNRLATRIARAFNFPPQAPSDVCFRAADSPVVWDTSLRGLTCRIDNHGMGDRLAHALHGDTSTGDEPRYSGFYGRLRVTLPDGDIWTVVVLGPRHFVVALQRLRQRADEAELQDDERMREGTT